MSLNYSSPRLKIRYALSRVGLWQPADPIRKIPSILNWLNSGCTKYAQLIQGDRGQRMPELRGDVTRPTLFWLDGHYSKGITAGSDIDPPISTELQTILDRSVKSQFKE